MISEDSIIYKVKPTKSKVVLVPILEEVLKGSLLLPQQKVEYYKVIATGPLCEYVKPSDVVLLDLSARNAYRNDEFMIADESCIAAIRLGD